MCACGPKLVPSGRLGRAGMKELKVTMGSELAVRWSCPMMVESSEGEIGYPRKRAHSVIINQDRQISYLVYKQDLERLAFSDCFW